MYMMHANLFLTVIIAHWISDFVFQTHWMASNKSRNTLALSSHVWVYTISIGCLLALFQPVFFLGQGIQLFMIWLIINGVLHFATDYVTSRITSKLWAAGRTHDFFVVVGIDQVIHYGCLIYTMYILI